MSIHIPPHYEKVVETMFENETFASVLDVGCGPLQYIDIIKRINPDVRLAGFDKDAGMVALANERIKETGLKNSETVVHDINSEPWPFDEKFETVIAVAMFLILTDEEVEIAMRNIKKRLGRRLLLLDMHSAVDEGSMRKSRNFKELLTRHGFTDIILCPVVGWPGDNKGYVIKATL